MRNCLRISAVVLPEEKRALAICDHLIQKGFDPKISRAIVFVQRRKDAFDVALAIEEHLAKKNAKLVVDAFHAGMSFSERKLKYENYKAGDIHLLIATKAFGMGMDIPNIHYVYHYKPSASLEDYLQEIGRAGRDRKGGVIYPCVLFYTPEDFDKLREIDRKSAFRVEHAEKLLLKILSIEFQIPSLDNRLAVVSLDEATKIFHIDSQSTAENWMRLALFRLEQAGRIKQLEYLPGSLNLKILDINALKKISRDGSIPARFANMLLGLIHGEEAGGDTLRSEVTNQPLPQKEGLLRKIIGNVLGFLGVRMKPVTNKDILQPIQSETPSIIVPSGQSDQTCFLNVGNAFRELGLKYRSDFFDAVLSLEKMNVIEVERACSLAVTKKRREEIINISENGGEPIFLNAYLKAAEMIMKRLKQGEFIAFSNQDISSILQRAAANITPNSIKWLNARQRKKIADEMKADLTQRTAGILHFISSLGAVVFEHIQNRAITYNIYRPRIFSSKAKMVLYTKIAPEILKLVWREESKERMVKLSALLGEAQKALRGEEGPRKAGDLALLKEVLHMLEITGYIHVNSELLPPSLLVEILRDDSINTIPEDKKIIVEIADQVKSKGLGIWALELFVILGEQDRDAFVKSFFMCNNTDELESLLSTYLDSRTTRHPELCDSMKTKFNRRSFENLKSELGEDPPKIELCQTPKKSNILVIAGPGSGKTKALLARIAFLISEYGVPPEKILVLTFNRAVVTEIRIRITELFASLGYGNYARSLRIETFHSFCLKALRDILSIKNMSKVDTAVQDFVDLVKENLGHAERVCSGVEEILVDEFQDMNIERYELLKQIANACGAAVTVVGDDDQDIMGWNRKKEPYHSKHYFEDFKRDFKQPFEFKLLKNFRSCSQIVEKTQSEIIRHKAYLSRNSTPIKKALIMTSATTDPGRAELLKDYDFEKAFKIIAKIPEQGEKLKDVAILCKNNAQVYEVEKRLRPLSQHHTMMVQGDFDERSFADGRVIAEMLDDFESADICDNKFAPDIVNDTINSIIKSKLKIKGQAVREIETLFLTALAAMYCYEEGKGVTCGGFAEYVRESCMSGSLLKFMREAEKAGVLLRHPRILVSTIHKIKGMEFDTVLILPGEMAAIFNQDREAEEFRTYYVAATRAKRNLVWFRGEAELSLYEGKKPPAFDTGKAFYLSSDGSNFFLSRPAIIKLNWNVTGGIDALQDYIQTDVCLDDPVQLNWQNSGPDGGDGSKGFLLITHNNKVIGGLSMHVNAELVKRKYNLNTLKTELFISDVKRVRYDSAVFGKYMWNTSPAIEEKGWFYSVFINGIILK